MSITLHTLNSGDGAKYVVNAIHKRDPLSIVSEVFLYLNALPSTRHYSSENIKDNESRYCAHISNFNAHGTTGISE